MDREEILKSLGGNVSEILDSIEKNDEKEIIEKLLVISEDYTVPKKERKNAKKVLYILKSRGYRIDKPVKKVSFSTNPDAGTRASKIGEKMFRLKNSYITVPDSTADYGIAFIASDTAETTYRFHFFLCNHWKGVVVDHVENRISKRRAFQLIESNEGFFSPGNEYTLFRLKRELEKSKGRKPLKNSLPGYLVYREIGEPGHPVLAHGGGLLSSVYSEELARHVFMNEEVSNISLPHDVVEEVLSEIRQVRSSRLIVSNMSPEQRLQNIVDRFMFTFFTRERLKTLQDMLFDVAYFLKDRDKETSKILASWGIELLRPHVALNQNPVIGYLIYSHFFAPFSRGDTSSGNLLITP